MPKAEKVEICQEPLVRDCDAEGENTCSVEYETVCETVYHENEVAQKGTLKRNYMVILLLMLQRLRMISHSVRQLLSKCVALLDQKIAGRFPSRYERNRDMLIFFCIHYCISDVQCHANDLYQAYS